VKCELHREGSVFKMLQLLYLLYRFMVLIIVHTYRLIVHLPDMIHQQGHPLKKESDWIIYQSSRRHVYDHHIYHRKIAFGTQHDGIVDRLQRPLWTNKK